MGITRNKGRIQIICLYSLCFLSISRYANISTLLSFSSFHILTKPLKAFHGQRFAPKPDLVHIRLYEARHSAPRVLAVLFGTSEVSLLSRIKQSHSILLSREKWSRSNLFGKLALQASVSVTSRDNYVQSALLVTAAW